MHSYESLKENHGTKVSQTIDSPIMVFDYFELSEIFAALFYSPYLWSGLLFLGTNAASVSAFLEL